MSIHVAIVKPPYPDLILRGRKRVESRLYRTRRAPVDAVRTGERVFLKRSAGRYFAVARIGAVEQHTDLKAGELEALRERHGERVAAPADYWAAHARCRHACFIELCEVEAVETGPACPARNQRGWLVLPERASPIADISLSAGALRNRYLPWPALWQRPVGMVELILPDGACVRTSLAPRARRLRWRGWGRYFEALGLRPGAGVRFVRLGEQRYRVLFPDSVDAHDGIESAEP